MLQRQNLIEHVTFKQMEGKDKAEVNKIRSYCKKKKGEKVKIKPKKELKFAHN